MQRVLVTGATGTVGRQVVLELLATDCRIRALTRNPDRADLPLQVEVVGGDLTDAESLERCLDGVDAVFSGVDGAIRCRPRRGEPDRTTCAAHRALDDPHKTAASVLSTAQPAPGLHAELERLIEESGMRWTFLRPGCSRPMRLRGGPHRFALATSCAGRMRAAPTAPIHGRDVAAVAVRALFESGHDGAEYVLTGPESLSQLEQVVTIGEVIGKPLRYEELSPEEARRELGFPAAAMTMLLDAWAGCTRAARVRHHHRRGDHRNTGAVVP